MTYNQKLPPFKWFILENFPYIEEDFDALTNWQLFCKLGKEMNKIIEKCNLTGEQVERLTTAFNELKQYVDDYFENLDVQDEIDNKLDEMAEQGVLTDIIAQYLQLAGVLAYDNKQAMKQAQNLADGSIAKTLGNTTYKDGRGSFFKVRQIQNTDVVDDENIIALYDPDLVAEKIVSYQSDDPTNPCFYGADPTGTIDSASAINQCIQSNLGKSIKFTPGKYIVNSSINTPYFNDEQVNIDFSGSILYSEAQLPYILGIGYYNYNDSVQSNRNNYTPGNYNTCAIFENFIINAPQSAVGIITRQGYYYPRIDNFSVLNCNVGIQIGHVENGGNSQDASITNGFIQCYDYKLSSNIGIVLNGHDTKIQNCRVYNGQIGIKINGSGNFISNTHIYLYGHFNERSTPEFATAFENTRGVLLNGSGNIFTNDYVDSYKIGYKSIFNQINDSFDGCWYTSNVNDVQKICFDYSENTTGQIESLRIVNGNFIMGTPGENNHNIGLKVPSNFYNNIANIDNLKIENNNTGYLEHDILSKLENGYRPFFDGTSVSYGNYYIIGYIPVIPGTNCVFSLCGIDKQDICKVWMNSNGIRDVARIVGTSGSNNGIGFKNVEFDGVKFIEVSASNQGGSTFGACIVRNMTGLNIPFLPAKESKFKYSITTLQTTPERTIDFA